MHKPGTLVKIRGIICIVIDDGNQSQCKKCLFRQGFCLTEDGMHCVKDWQNQVHYEAANDGEKLKYLLLHGE